MGTRMHTLLKRGQSDLTTAGPRPLLHWPWRGVGRSRLRAGIHVKILFTMLRGRRVRGSLCKLLSCTSPLSLRFESHSAQIPYSYTISLPFCTPLSTLPFPPTLSLTVLHTFFFKKPFVTGIFLFVCFNVNIPPFARTQGSGSKTAGTKCPDPFRNGIPNRHLGSLPFFWLCLFQRGEPSPLLELRQR